MRLRPEKTRHFRAKRRKNALLHSNTLCYYSPSAERCQQLFARIFYFFGNSRKSVKIRPLFFRKVRTRAREEFMRIDKFLKVSRILKRRTVAQEAADAGKIRVNGKEVKPAYRVKVGDEVELSFTSGTLRFRVLAIKETVKKDEAGTLYEVFA